jgi:3D (Asp-Asp-Asp) domain-containing protein
METKETEIEMSKAAVERARIEEQNQYEEMKKRIQYMYERSSSDYLVSLLNSSTVREFLNRADHFKEVNNYDRGRLADYQEARQIVMRQQEALEKEEASLEVLKSEYETKQAEVENLASTTGAKITEFTQNISNEELTLSNLQQKITSQTSLLENLTEKLADAKARKEEEERKAAEAARLAAEKAAEEARLAAEREAEEARLAAEKVEAEKKAAEVAKAAEEAKAQKEQEEALVRIEEAQKAASARIEAVERDAGSSSDYTVKLRDDQLSYLGTFKLTAYCPCAQCCGWENGPTASGVYPTAEHTVAMAGVPFGTKLLINGRIYTVEDLGTPYGHADIFMNSHGTCLQFGVGYAEVYQVFE